MPGEPSKTAPPVTPAKVTPVKKKMVDAHLEEKKVKGAIKTDFILSGEIMTITLSALPEDLSLPMVAASLGVAGIVITVAVYGAVALIVKADDVGLAMANKETAAVRKSGELIVKGMPYFMKLLVVVGTGAMIWVGGSILIHGLHEMGWHLPFDTIHGIAAGAAGAVPESLHGFVEWLVTATLDGIIGLIFGFLLMPVVKHVLAPIAGVFSRGEKKTETP